MLSRVDILSKNSEILPLSFPEKGILWHILEKFPTTIMHDINANNINDKKALTKQLDSSIPHNKLKKKIKPSQ